MALERACGRLLSLHPRRAGGRWQTNVTMDADTCCCASLGHQGQGGDRLDSLATARRRSAWANFFGGTGDLSRTIEAYWPAERRPRPHAVAADFIRGEGGIERARVFTHVWLALFGLWPWEQAPALPLVLLPAWVPLNIYDFACWARQTIGGAVGGDGTPSVFIAVLLHQLHGTEPWRPAPAQSARGRWLTRLDRVLRAYERRPPARPVRRLALGRAEGSCVARTVVGRHPARGCSLMALHLDGYPLEHPLTTSRDRGDHDRGSLPHRGGEQAPGGLPVAGVGYGAGDGRARLRGSRWTTRRWCRRVAARRGGGRRGHWRVARLVLEPGGWAFEFANGTPGRGRHRRGGVGAASLGGLPPRARGSPFFG